jgi:hypothetical protein
VAVNPDVAAAAMIPVALYPVSAVVRRLGIVAGYPDIVRAVPAVKAGLPDPTVMGCDGDDLNRTRRGWADADYDLCAGRGSRESDAGDRDEDGLPDLHGVFLLEEESFLLLGQTPILKRKLW